MEFGRTNEVMEGFSFVISTTGTGQDDGDIDSVIHTNDIV
jgi:hypothetical protein